MWLLNTRTAELREYQSVADLRYAILSHVWQKDEQSFQDVQALRGSDDALSRVSAKIRECCRVAARDGFDWLWIDTCCINKASSAELSEAINSMYAWYANATICYAYLHDVGDTDDPRDLPSPFRRSRWFTRGWTLQELIAPRCVVFLSTSWYTIGTKETLAQVIESITGIDSAVLMHTHPIKQVSVARRMSWAAKRQTTREEDRAYSLMGVFGVNMSTIYGEGRNAFLRLQEEILKRSPDQSLFLWGRSVDAADLHSESDSSESDCLPDPDKSSPNTLLASSPAAFLGCAESTPFAHEQLTVQLHLSPAPKPPEYRTTSYGIRMEIPLVPLSATPLALSSFPEATCLAILACHNKQGALAALLLRAQPNAIGRYFVGVGGLRIVFLPPSFFASLAIGVTDVVLHPFESHDVHPCTGPITLPLHATRGYRVGSNTSTNAATTMPTFAFFIPQLVIRRLKAMGYIVDNTAALRSSLERDGYSFGRLQYEWGMSEISISFSRGTHSMKFVLGLLPCSCEIGATGNASSKYSGLWCTAQATGEFPPPEPIDIHTRSDFGRMKRRLAYSVASSESARSEPLSIERISRPLRTHDACSRSRVHLPIGEVTTLQFVDHPDRPSLVEMEFRIWRECPISTLAATHVYILDIKVDPATISEPQMKSRTQLRTDPRQLEPRSERERPGELHWTAGIWLEPEDPEYAAKRRGRVPAMRRMAEIHPEPDSLS